MAYIIMAYGMKTINEIQAELLYLKWRNCRVLNINYEEFRRKIGLEKDNKMCIRDRSYTLLMRLVFFSLLTCISFQMTFRTKMFAAFSFGYCLYVTYFFFYLRFRDAYTTISNTTYLSLCSVVPLKIPSFLRKVVTYVKGKRLHATNKCIP